MSEAASLLPLAESIADGGPIDWAGAEAGATSDEQDVIRQLRIVANLAMLHRTLPTDAHGLDSASRGRPQPTATAIGVWGHLALIERLGEGAAGEVYRAWDPHLEWD